MPFIGALTNQSSANTSSLGTSSPSIYARPTIIIASVSTLSSAVFFPSGRSHVLPYNRNGTMHTGFPRETSSWWQRPLAVTVSKRQCQHFMDALAITARTADKIPTARPINEIIITGRQRRQTDWTIVPLLKRGEHVHSLELDFQIFCQRLDSVLEVANRSGPLPPGPCRVRLSSWLCHHHHHRRRPAAAWQPSFPSCPYSNRLAT